MAHINGYPVINNEYDDHPSKGRGYELRDKTAYPLGHCGGVFGEPLFSDQELREIIAQKDAEQSWITDHCDRANSPVKNQKSSNYCWIHAPVRGMEIAYILAGDPVKRLSAFYGGAIIKGGRNQGGSGIVAVEWLAKYGTPLERYHEPMNFSPRPTSEAKASATAHRIERYEDVDPDNHQAIKTAVAINYGVTVGIPAWGHEVLITRLTLDNRGEIRYVIDNSWGTDWGNNGRGVLEGRYTRFDEAGIVRTVTPSMAK